MICTPSKGTPALSRKKKRRWTMKRVSARLACLLLLAIGIAAATSVVYGADGRWKLGGDGSCFFDPNDTGPDQCSPSSPTGRWKVGGDGTCVFDPNDTGPDQCTPGSSPDVPVGRWKLGDDNTCYFDPTDSGPNQCSPTAAAAARASIGSLDALLRSLRSSTVIPQQSSIIDASQSSVMTATADIAHAR
jgi:hypothetical protein